MPQQNYIVSDAPHPRVEIRNCHNRVTVVGWDDAQTITVDRAARQEGDTIFVEDESKVTVRAPRAAIILIHDCEADVRVEDMAGAIELDAINGDVALKNLSGTARVIDVDGDLSANSVANLIGEGRWEKDVIVRDTASVQVDKIEGDLVLQAVGTATIRKIEGDLSGRGLTGALTIEQVEGDISLRDARGPIAIAKVDGDLVASNLCAELDAPDVDGDAVISFDQIAETTLRAEGDVVLHLPTDANAELELDAKGDLVIRANLNITEETESRVRGTLGTGGAKIRVESSSGDVIVRGGADEHRHSRKHPHAHAWDDEQRAQIRQMKERITAQVRESVRASLNQVKVQKPKQGFGFILDMEPPPPAENSAPAAPRPAAGSPERKAILDAIARGELNVDDAIKKLTGDS